MFKKLSFLYPVFLFLVPLAVGAQGINKLVTDAGNLINRLIPVLIGLAVLVFLFGVIRFIFSSDGPQKSEAKQFMLWGIIALFVMVSVWGLVRILNETLGIRTNEVPRLPVVPTR